MPRISLELEFPVTYEIEQLGHIDQSGERPTYSYPYGTAVDRQSNHADRPILAITPETGEPWVGVFYGGNHASPPAAPAQLLAWPDRKSFCVVYRGGAVVVRSDAPQETYEIDIHPVLGVTVVRRKRLVVFADYTNLIAYGADGLVWRTPRLALDEVRVVAVERETLVVSGFFGGHTNDHFTVDLATGKASGQPFQPPD